MDAPSQAELFFNSIPISAGRGFKFLEKLAQISAQTDENEWRDFKEAKQLTFANADEGEIKKNAKKIKSIWSENIGAFANSSGGVLIWGIKAPQRLADGLSLAADAPQLAERLQELANEAVDPPVLGIQIRAYVKNRADKSGFVVCLIPPSKHPPHRSKFADKDFYIRAQDGNINCPTAILRRLFYPVSSPNLIPEVTIRINKEHDNNIRMAGSIRLINQGNLSANQICVNFIGPYTVQIDKDTWEQPEFYRKQFWSKMPVHPQQSQKFVQQFTRGGIHTTWPDDEVKEEFQIEIFASNASPVYRSFSISWGDLRECSGKGIFFLDYGFNS